MQICCVRPRFDAFFKWPWQSKGTIMPQCSAIFTIKLCQQVDGIACMYVEIKVYHIFFTNPHCRHGKRQALERPVLGNLSKGGEAGYKKTHSITASCDVSVGLDFTLIVANPTVIPFWSIVISVSLRTLPAMVVGTVYRELGGNYRNRKFEYTILININKAILHLNYTQKIPLIIKTY